ncbi:MAG: hypothetical protein ACI9YL_000349 [Luteibaculaceae bacterium]|jgi:hypothetical protein
MVQKSRVTLEYDKVNETLKEQIKLVYPEGFSEYLIEYKNQEGKKVTALRFETDEKVHLIRMTESQAIRIIEADADYDEDGVLHEGIRVEYEEKHSEVEYLRENENYEG